MNEDKRGNESTACYRCSRQGIYQIEGKKWVCEECYYACGSCCLEFGSDDLWSDQESRKQKRNEEKGAGEGAN